MILTIYDSNGNLRAAVPPNGSSTQQKEVQGGNVLSVSFTHYERIAFDVNDYADFMGERYWLMDRYAPAQKSEGEWVYDVKMYGIESLIGRFLVLESTDGNAEPVFTLTAHPAEHLAMIVKCINDGMGTTEWQAGRVDGTDNITIDYEGKFCDEALKELAEKIGGKTEWWVDGHSFNLCRCEHGDQIALGYGNGLTSLERVLGTSGKFYTRLFPIGSSRNIDPGRYSHSRLMLPGGRKFVEVHTDEYGIHDRYEKDAFSGIYPRRLGIVSSVRSEDVTDGNGKSFRIYYFTDQALDFNPNEHELPGETKRVSFQSGELSGLGQGDDHYFEVNYNAGTNEFEIVTIWPYGDETQLPGGYLVPNPGDGYILWNIRMPDEYYALAEQEFLDAVEQYNQENWQDASVFKAPTDHVWIEDRGVCLSVGRKVRLESARFFPDTGYRDSRITKITRSVEHPGKMDLEISDTVSQGAMEAINDRISKARTYAKAAASSMADIIGCEDETAPTDNNVLSAKRSYRDLLSSVADDVAKGKITFEQGAEFGEFISSLYFGKGGAVDEHGNAELESLRVRGGLEVLELIMNRLSAIEGDQLLTEADTIERVVDLGDNCYGLYLKSKWEGYFTAQYEHNVLKGIVNTLAAGSGTYYTSWMRVNSVNTALNYIEVAMYPDDETPAGRNFPPCEMMKVARWGNQTDKRRQSCLYLSSTEGRIVHLVGVDKPIIEDYNYASSFGSAPEFLKAMDLPLMDGMDYVYARGLIVQDMIRVDVQGKPIPTYVDRGPFVDGEAYYCLGVNPDTGILETSDTWRFGCKYRCLHNLTTEAPAWNSTHWAMIEGNPEFTVDFAEPENIFDPDRFDTTLTIVARMYNMDVTRDILDTDIEWTRYSEDPSGNQRVASDNAWALEHAGAGKSLRLTISDCDCGSAGMPGVLRFTATVTLRDGMGEVAAIDSVSYEHN